MINSKSYDIEVELASEHSAMNGVSWKIRVNGMPVFVPLSYRTRPFNTAKTRYISGSYGLRYSGDVFCVWIRKNSWLIDSLRKIVRDGIDMIRKIAEAVYQKIQLLDW